MQTMWVLYVFSFVEHFWRQWQHCCHEGSQRSYHGPTFQHRWRVGLLENLLFHSLLIIGWPQ